MLRRMLLGGMIVTFLQAAGAAGPGPAVPVTGFLDRTLTLDGEVHRYQVYVPLEFTPERTWPVVLFLHGSGERGRDGLRQTQVGLPAALRWERDRVPAIVVMPQLPPERTWTERMADLAMAALDSAVAEFRGDPQRRYLTGMSLGGYGTWHLAAEHPGVFAALAPVCGGVVPPAGRTTSVVQMPATVGADDPYTEAAGRIGSTPTWIFHGADDPVVPAFESRRMHAALQALGNDARYTEYPGVGHASWEQAYGEAAFWTWLLAQRRR